MMNNITLREATAMVIADVLNDTNGTLGFEDLDSMSSRRKLALAVELVNSDDFLERLESSLEDMVSEYLEDYGDEYGIKY